MRKVLNIIGTLLIFLGTVWFLQGINLMPGSFMSGQVQWAIYGGVAVAAGLLLLLAARRLNSGQKPPKIY